CELSSVYDKLWRNFPALVMKDFSQMTKKIMLMKIYLLKFILLHLEERGMEEMVVGTI
ncbi:Hypothetical predicted protein, partial [Paramuricea clavata]